MNIYYQNPGWAWLTTNSAWQYTRPAFPTGVAYYTPQSDKIETCPLNGTPREIWVKLDFTLGSSEQISVYDYSQSYKAGFIYYQTGKYYLHRGSSSYSSTGTIPYVSGVNTLLFHAKASTTSSSSDGLLELYDSNGAALATWTGICHNGEPWTCINIWTSGEVSNIIISDTRPDINRKATFVYPQYIRSYLSANGTLGTDDLAIYASCDNYAYCMLDESPTSECTGFVAGEYIVFATATPIYLRNLFLASYSKLVPASGTLSWSDDNSTWTQCSEWSSATLKMLVTMKPSGTDYLTPDAHKYWRLDITSGANGTSTAGTISNIGIFADYTDEDGEYAFVDTFRSQKLREEGEADILRHVFPPEIQENTYDIERVVVVPTTPAYYYENPGLVELTLGRGKTIKTDVYSNTGYAYGAIQHSTGSGNAKAFKNAKTIPIKDSEATNEIYIRLDAYHDSTDTEGWVIVDYDWTGLTYAESNKFETVNGIYVNPVNNRVLMLSNGTAKNKLMPASRLNGFHKYLLHMKSATNSETADGLVELWIDGQCQFTYRGAVNPGKTFNYTFILSLGSSISQVKTWFSNVIVSDQYIDPCAVSTMPLSEFVFYQTWYPSNYTASGYYTSDNYVAFGGNSSSPGYLFIGEGSSSDKFEIGQYTIWRYTERIKVNRFILYNWNEQLLKAGTIYYSDDKGNTWTSLISWTLENEGRNQWIELSPTYASEQDGYHDWFKIVCDDRFNGTSWTLQKMYEGIGVLALDAVRQDNSVRVDLLRHIQLDEIGLKQTRRLDAVKYTFTSETDVLRRARLNEESEVDIEYIKHIIEETSIPIYRTVEALWWDESSSNDIQRTSRLIEETQTDIRRQVPYQIADTQIETPVYTPVTHQAGTWPEKHGYNISAATAGKGLSSIRIHMVESNLTDTIEFTLVGENDIELMLPISGYYLDYDYSVLVESVRRTNISQDVSCMVTKDMLINETIKYSSTGDMNAQAYCQAMANKCGLTLDYRAASFSPYTPLTDVYITPQSLLSNITSWSKHVPTRQINPYVRNNVLHVIQRGQEANVVDISNLEITRPIVNRSVYRVDKIDIPDLNSGLVFGEPQWNVYYEGGRDDSFYNKGETHENHTSANEYDTDGNISKKTVTNGDGSRTEIEYIYANKYGGSKYLAKQVETIYDAYGSLVDSKTTEYEYEGAGQYSAISFRNGTYEGSSIGYGNSQSNELSDYDKRQSWMTLRLEKRTHESKSSVEWDRLRSMFPLKPNSFAIEMANLYNSMYCKTEEQISCDIYNYNHVITFNDRIRYNGNEYFLVSNSVLKDARITNRQSITAVRWY